MPYSKTDLAVSLYSKVHLSSWSKGASLIEVLVALIIFSIGVLGIVGLQLSAVNNSQINNHFIQARLISDNLANRIKLNKNAIILPNQLTSEETTSGLVNTLSEYFSVQSYDLSLYGSCLTSYYQCFCQQVPANIPTCRITSCSPTELAKFDTYEVACMLALMSNATKINVSYTAINTDALWLSINLIWPVQGLHAQNQSSNKANQNSLLFSDSNSDCLQVMPDLSVSNTSFMCYSQSLVIAAVYYDD